MKNEPLQLEQWALGIAFFYDFDRAITRYIGPNHEGTLPLGLAWYGDELSIAHALYNAYLRKQKSKDGRYITPPEVAVQLVISLGLRPGMRVLDPCAGIGSLLWQARLTGAEVCGYEIDYRAWCVARQMGLNITNGNYFVDSNLNRVLKPDAVLLVPPFTRIHKYEELAGAFLEDVARYHVQVSCLLTDYIKLPDGYAILEKDSYGDGVYAPLIKVDMTRYLLQSMV